MAPSQDHATPPEEDIDSAPTFNLRKRPHECVDEVSEELEFDLPRNCIATAQVRIPARLEQLVPIKKHDCDRDMSSPFPTASAWARGDRFPPFAPTIVHCLSGRSSAKTQGESNSTTTSFAPAKATAAATGRCHAEASTRALPSTMTAATAAAAAGRPAI